MVRFVCPLPLRPIDFLPTGEPPLGHSGRVRLGFLWYAGDFLAAGQIARAGHSNDVFCTPLSLYVLLETWPRLRAWHGFSDFLLLGTNCSVTGGRTRRVAAPRAVLPNPPPPPRPSTHHVTEQAPSLLPGRQTDRETMARQGPKFAMGSVYRALGAGLGFLPIQTH